MIEKPRRAAIYARTSTTKDQDPETQLRELRPFVARRGWSLKDEHLFVDFGVSGAKDSRPGLDRMLAAARRREYDVLCVWAIDRLGRSLRGLILTCEELGRLGVDLVSYTQSAIDTTSPTGRLTFAVMAAVSEWERDHIRSRIAAGIARARASGTRLGRPPVDLDLDYVRGVLGTGESIRSLARRLGVSDSTIRRALSRGAPEPVLAEKST